MHLPLQLVLLQLMTDMRVLESAAALHAWERNHEGNSSGSDIRANTPEMKASCSVVTHACDNFAREAAAVTSTKTNNMQAAMYGTFDCCSPCEKPCRCLWRGSALQITNTFFPRRTMLQLLQIFFTAQRTRILSQ